MYRCRSGVDKPDATATATSVLTVCAVDCERFVLSRGHAYQRCPVRTVELSRSYPSTVWSRVPASPSGLIHDAGGTVPYGGGLRHRVWPRSASRSDQSCIADAIVVISGLGTAKRLAASAGCGLAEHGEQYRIKDRVRNRTSRRTRARYPLHYVWSPETGGNRILTLHGRPPAASILRSAP